MLIYPASPQPGEVKVKPQSFTTPESYHKGVRKAKVLSIIAIVAAVLIAAGGIAATVLTGISALWAIPVLALVLSVVLVLVIYNVRPKLSFTPFVPKTPVLGFANTEPDFAEGLGAELLNQQ
ncbi:hypothetical protein [Chlamydia caviae]|uniref:Uncharacterized protein n=1 Tax=Chlamydia caviae (strain ATCC VR-813 / DSM 19441 / 03DC25 / GPIC) TaxID=227941 RepID=Q823L3_CHLCV|nr:hypothetical protein [Chlamydia caviae]AAP05143.1 hypothetical protein CCA_00397 [Chlamydia caviae GPIC]